MRRSLSTGLLALDPEIERTLRKLRQQQRSTEMTQENETEVKKALRDYAAPSMASITSSIRRPVIQNNNFEIKSGLIQMVQQHQFGGTPAEDPTEHLSNFQEICGTLKVNGVTGEAIKLMLFSFSVRDKAKSWLNSFPQDFFTTWEELTSHFLAKYFPHSKASKLRDNITSFVQQEGESVYEAWERYKEALRKVPNHGLPEWLEIEFFYKGLTQSTRSMIDAAAGGSLMAKTRNEAYSLLDEIASNSYQWGSERATKKAGLYEVEAFTALQAQIAALSKKLEAQTVNAVTTPMPCNSCGGPHNHGECISGQNLQEQVYFMNNNNAPTNNPYSNTYNAGWRNHPNLGWGNNNAPRPMQGQTYQPPQEKKSNLEKMMETLTANTVGLQAETKAFMTETRTCFKNQSAAIHNLEVQVGNLAAQLANRSQGTMPSDTVKNPKEQINVIKLRSGKQVQGTKTAKKKNQMPQETARDQTEGHCQKQCPQCGSRTASQPFGRPAGRPTEELQADFEPESSSLPEETSETPAEVNTLPFPSRMRMKDPDVSKFMEIFTKLQVNIPFADMVEQVPRYARYLKDILSKKKKLPHGEQVQIAEQCSAVLTRQLPKKEKDPGSFSVRCEIGKEKTRGLCDLGASINLMPLSIFKRLKIGQMKHTDISLLMADRSEVKPVGVVENVLVKIEHLLYPVDFVVIDVVEDSIPLILGRPFLFTAHAVIDVFKGQMTLEMGEENLLVRMFEQESEPAAKAIDDDEFFEEEYMSYKELMQKRAKEYWDYSGVYLQGCTQDMR